MMKYNDLDSKKLGKIINKMLSFRKITPAKLAAKVDTCERHILNIISGTSKPSLGLLIAIANELNVSLDVLLSDSLINKGNRLQQISDLTSDFSDKEFSLIIDIICSIHNNLHK